MRECSRPSGYASCREQNPIRCTMKSGLETGKMAMRHASPSRACHSAFDVSFVIKSTIPTIADSAVAICQSRTHQIPRDFKVNGCEIGPPPGCLMSWACNRSSRVRRPKHHTALLHSCLHASRNLHSAQALPWPKENQCVLNRPPDQGVPLGLLDRFVPSRVGAAAFGAGPNRCLYVSIHFGVY